MAVVAIITCLICRTGEYSHVLSDAEKRIAEVMACACWNAIWQINVMVTLWRLTKSWAHLGRYGTAVLHICSSGDPAWYEHDMQSTARHVLMSCAHLYLGVNVETRHRKLRGIIDGLDVAVIIRSRYSVWCCDHYSGNKYGTGIYSTEETAGNWITAVMLAIDNNGQTGRPHHS